MDKAMHSEFEGHTPRPWSVRTAKEFIKPRTFEIINREGLLIASVNIGMFDVERNANLIASAPDLLKENESLRSELQRLQYDLDDALDIKNGNGPTALSRLSNELQKQRELNAELLEVMKAVLNEVDSQDYFGSISNATSSVIESLIKKSKPA